jgi:hypothetical protein
MVKREVVAACMESPLYFTIPLRKRLDLVKQIHRDGPPSKLPQVFLSWVKKGHFQP